MKMMFQMLQMISCDHESSLNFGNGEVALRFNHEGRKLRRDVLLDVVLPDSSRLSDSSMTVSKFYLDGVTTKDGIWSFTESILIKLELVVR